VNRNTRISTTIDSKVIIALISGGDTSLVIGQLEEVAK